MKVLTILVLALSLCACSKTEHSTFEKLSGAWKGSRVIDTTTWSIEMQIEPDSTGSFLVFSDPPVVADVGGKKIDRSRVEAVMRGVDARDGGGDTLHLSYEIQEKGKPWQQHSMTIVLRADSLTLVIPAFVITLHKQ